MIKEKKAAKSDWYGRKTTNKERREVEFCRIDSRRSAGPLALGACVPPLMLLTVGYRSRCWWMDTNQSVGK